MDRSYSTAVQNYKNYGQYGKRTVDSRARAVISSISSGTNPLLLHLMTANLRFALKSTSTFAALALGCFFVPAPVAQAAVIDGIVTAGEYANMRVVPFIDGGKIVSDAGQIFWQVEANGDVSVAFITPRSVNDNTYGGQSIGWKPPKNPTTPQDFVNEEHKFSNLTGSDKGVFEFTDGTGKKFEVTIDYITEIKNANPLYPTGFASLGAAGGDGGVKGINVNQVVAATTSLTYNLNTLFPNEAGFYSKVNNVDPHSPAALPVIGQAADGSIIVDYSQPYQVTNPAFQGWVFDMIYEVRISATAFQGGFANVAFIDSHNSPAKSGAQVVIIPEPASALGGALLLFGAFGRELGRKRSRARRRET